MLEINGSLKKWNFFRFEWSLFFSFGKRSDLFSRFTRSDEETICEHAKYVSFEILHKIDHGFIPYNEYFGFPRFKKAKKNRLIIPAKLVSTIECYLLLESDDIRSQLFLS